MKELTECEISIVSGGSTFNIPEFESACLFVGAITLVSAVIGYAVNKCDGLSTGSIVGSVAATVALGFIYLATTAYNALHSI